MDSVRISDTMNMDRIIHGHWRLMDWKMTPEELLSFTKEVLELGVSTIDTADIYGGFSCEEALRRLQTVLPISSLGEIDSETFGKYQHVIEDDVLIKRAKHAVTENERTLLAVKALESNEIEEFGKLMNASHESLKEDYEVTGTELDTLVELARKVSGTIGSRMTGAGFGGCTVSIVQNDAIERFIQEVGTSYEEIIGYKAEFYVVSIGDGVHKLS